jgi:hypothetical protein
VSAPDRLGAVLAEIDRRTELARKATPGPWQVEPRRRGGWITAGEKGYDDVVAPGAVDCGFYCQGGSSVVEISAEDAAFIAANDPSHALAVLALHRELLTSHTRVWKDTYSVCAHGCGSAYGRSWPCAVVERLLDIYATPLGAGEAGQP